jgi:predicted negative regulator of RcsB-dependent stress response
MTEVGSYKWVEVLVLLAAGGGFVWWQFRDLKRAKQESAARRQAAGQADAGAPEAKPAEDASNATSATAYTSSTPHKPPAP